MNNPRKEVKIYDNGGRTIDRYTLMMPDNESWGFNDSPYHPQGFGQYSGTIPRLRSYSHLGKKIALRNLPPQAQRFVKDIIASYSRNPGGGIEWIIIGDTTFASDPAGYRRSFPVYTSSGMRHYYVYIRRATYKSHVDRNQPYGLHYAEPAHPTGFNVTAKVPRGKIPPGLVSRIMADVSRGVTNPVSPGTDIRMALLDALKWTRANAHRSVEAAAALEYIQAFDLNRLTGERLGIGMPEADAVQLAYILNNLRTWRGDVARKAKEVIKSRMRVGGIRANPGNPRFPSWWGPREHEAYFEDLARKAPVGEAMQFMGLRARGRKPRRMTRGRLEYMSRKGALVNPMELTWVRINQLGMRLPLPTEDEDGNVTLPNITDAELNNAVARWAAEVHFTGHVDIPSLRRQLVQLKRIA